MEKQERREKMAQDLKERPDIGTAPMSPEEFANVAKSYICQRLCGCENTAVVDVEEDSTAEERITEKEFKIAKKALLEILSDSNCSPSLRLNAAENLAALSAAYEQSRWGV